MPDTYKNYGTSIGVTAATSVYAGITGTAIVNAIHVANSNTTLANSVSFSCSREQQDTIS